MSGIGTRELPMVGLLALVVFGPAKAAGVGRDFVRPVDGANRTVEEFKGELVPEELKEVRRTVEEVNDEASQFTDEGLGGKAASDQGPA